MRLTWPEKDHSRASCDQAIERMRNNHGLPYKRVHHFINVLPTDIELKLVLETPFGITALLMTIAGH